MQLRITLPTSARLAPLFLAAALTGCGSSDSAIEQQDPGGGDGELPEEFALLISDRTPMGPQLGGGARPYLYDFSTEELREVGASLPADQDISSGSAVLSPDGRWLYATFGFFPDLSTYVVDLQEDITRLLPLPAIGSGAMESGNGNPVFSFSPDSSRVAVLAVGNGVLGGTLFVCASDGSGLQRVQVDDQGVRALGWLGDSTRFLVRYYEEALQTDVVAVLDSSGALSAPMQVSTSLDVDIDEVSISADGSAIAAMIELELPSGEYVYEVATLDLETSTTARFSLAGFEVDIALMNDTGEYVALLFEEPNTGERQLMIGEVATGIMEVATLPLAHGGDPDLDDDNLFWEPGGPRLAFASSHRDESAEELTIASFGTAPMAVDPTVDPNTDVGRVTWSPNGALLAYADEAPGDVLKVFNADSLAPPIIVTDTTFSSDPRGVVWSPDGQFLIAGEETESSIGVQVVVYAAPSFERVGVLGRSYNGSILEDAPFRSGVAQVTFSRNGRDMLWLVDGFGSEPDQLLSASLDDLAAPAVNVAGSTPSGTAPQISQFWLRR